MIHGGIKYSKYYCFTKPSPPIGEACRRAAALYDDTDIAVPPYYAPSCAYSSSSTAAVSFWRWPVRLLLDERAVCIAQQVSRLWSQIAYAGYMTTGGEKRKRYGAIG